MNTPTKEEIYSVLCARHTKENQDKLMRAKVAVAGLGGLGSNIAVQLARVGIGQLHLIDFDTVDLSNLNRQHYFIRHLGMNKTDALAQQLLQINPYLQIETDCIKLTEKNIAALLKDDDYICEAFDVPENKAMLVNAVLELFPHKKLVAASGMAGFGDNNAIRTRQIMRNFYLCGDGKSGIDTKKTLTAPRVALCAAHEANMIVQLILEE